MRLRALQAEGPVVLEDSGRTFLCGVETGAQRFEPPALQPPRAGESLDAYVQRLEAGPRRQLLVLVQAGATALGLWAGEALIAHKVIKKYVVRGHGKAQPAHLKTRGKSRYGSRLRLRNAQAQLVQTNEKILAWWGLHGPADDVFLSCPTRTVPELFAVRPPPPFAREAVHRIRLDVHVPDFAELQDVYRRMARGRLGPAPLLG